MATKIVGFNIHETSDPIVDQFKATTHVETPLIRILTSGTDLNLTNRITASNASGSNSITPALRISSGRSTGSAAGGNLIFQISSPGTSGSTVNAFTDVTEISYNSFDIKDLSFSVDGSAFTVAKDSGNTSVLGTLNVGSDVTIGGNLTVNGTTTTVNSTTISVDDKNLELGSIASPDDTSADGGGITLKGATDKTLNWYSTGGNWTSSENFSLVTGKIFKINNIEVLSSTKVLQRTPGGTVAGDIATIDASQTLTNKSLSDSTTYIIDETDATKKLQFQISGISTATTRTLTAPNLNGTIALIDTAQTFTASHTFRNASGQRVEAASTQDAVIISGRAGGTSSYGVTIIPTTLSASRTLTLPNVSGTVVSTGDTGTVTNTMLAGSISNDKLVNNSVTFNGTTVALGSSGTITSALSVGLKSGGNSSVYSSFSGGSLYYTAIARDGSNISVLIA